MLKEAPRGDKHKWVAVFDDAPSADGRTTSRKEVKFGARGFQDYTQHHSTERRDAYRTRHLKDLHTRDPSRAGFLSYYLLWGDSTDIKENLRRYKNHFNL